MDQQPIVIVGTIEVEPGAREQLLASTVDLQRSTRVDEPGCLVYSLGADPVEPGRIQIVEVWASADALDAHFQHPNFAAIGEALRAAPRLGGGATKYRVDATDAVRGPDGKASSRFWSAE